MSTKEPRIKISQDRTRICKYCIGDRVIVSFRKYGVKKFEEEFTLFVLNMYYVLMTRGIGGITIGFWKNDYFQKYMEETLEIK